MIHKRVVTPRMLLSSDPMMPGSSTTGSAAPAARGEIARSVLAARIWRTGLMPYSFRAAWATLGRRKLRFDLFEREG